MTPDQKIKLKPWFYFVAGGGEALSASAIALNACPACVGELMIGGIPLRLLAPVGIAVGLAFTFSSRFPALRPAFDALAVLQAMSGLAVLALAASRAALPCPLCIVLWTCAFALAGEALTRLAVRTPIRPLLTTWAVALTLLSISPIGRSELAKWATIPNKPAHRVVTGSRIDLADGLHGFITSCPPCALQRFLPVFREAKARNEAITLHTVNPSPEYARMFPTIKIVVDTAERYKHLGVEIAGDPLLVRMRGGSVAAAGRAEDLR